MKETVRMSRKELTRLRILHQVESRAITLRQGAEEMGVCERQAKRLWKRFKSQGEAGLVHAGRGRVSNRRTSVEKRRAIVDVYKAHYADYGPTLAAEVLAREHGIEVHRETLRRILHAECLLTPHSRPRVHRKRRPRREHFGALVQMDGSFHDWFEERRARTCLMVAVDDATGRSLVWMNEEETTRDAYALLQKWIGRYGVPEALYVDRRSVYVVDREANAEEKRQGSGPLTDFGRACWRLGIRIVAAHSPEAKGRVERRNGLLQDRLVKELRRRNISTIEGANAMLDGLCAELDARFAIAPASPIDRHRRRPSTRALRETLCWEETRTVAKDWTVAWQGAHYQIARQSAAPKPGCQVTVRRLMDGTIRIVHEGRRLRIAPAAGSDLNHLVTRPPSGGRAAAAPPQTVAVSP